MCTRSCSNPHDDDDDYHHHHNVNVEFEDDDDDDDDDDFNEQGMGLNEGGTSGSVSSSSALLHFIRRTHMVPLRCTKLLYFIWHTHIHVLYKAAQQCQQRWSILSHTHMCAVHTVHTEYIKCTVGKEKCTTDEISAPFYQTCTHGTRLLHWSGTLNLPNISAALFYQTHTPGCIVHKIVQQECNTIQNAPNENLSETQSWLCNTHLCTQRIQESQYNAWMLQPF